MISAPGVRAGAVVLGLLCLPSAAFARQAAAPAPVAAERSPFQRGLVGLEFGGGAMTEAWNLNGARETLINTTFALWWTYQEGRSLVVEFHTASVFQEAPRTAFVQALVPILRCRVLQRGQSSVFIEMGAGLSWSDTVTPPRGTRLNYLTLTSVGLTRRLTRQTHAVASLRWLHLSNASLEGRNRNPDIEALGGYFGLFVGF